ncbi:MAG: leucine-rich repeat protein [Lachnospira sp.]|nr:leucine-rich repeat protein [Lachnospira sp.]
MHIIIILAIVFVIMLLTPFVSAIVYCKSRQGKILTIRQEKIKDARYFGKSFAKLVEENVSVQKDGVINLSKEETYIDGDKTTEFPSIVEELVICREKDFVAPEGVKGFAGEIYSNHNVIINKKNVSLRAAYAKECMIVGDAVSVDRWVDAEQTLAVYDNCDLGMSASAGQRLSVGKGCSFRRLYAPEILVGQYPATYVNPMENRESRILEAAKQLEVVRNVNYVSKDMTNSQGEADITVLTRENLVVLENIIVRGDVRSHKSVRLCDNSVVCGNIFAEDDIHIGKNATVLGNVFTQGSIYVEEGAMIGKPGQITSMIAKDTITMAKNVCVFGYVSCERGGKIVSSNAENASANVEFLTKPQFTTQICFDDIEEYEKLSVEGFRKQELLKSVKVDVETKEVAKSMFFGCKSLEEVVLPESVEVIGAYAFADCFRLKDITACSDMSVRTIGTSAFENCRNLQAAIFGETLQSLGAAAFAGCSGLKRVQFAGECGLTHIGDHCFNGCENLESIELPDSVEVVGVSAFANCKKLIEISVPAGCETQPGIEQLRQETEVQVCVRSL